MLARELGRTLPAIGFCDDERLVNLGFETRSIEDHPGAYALLRDGHRPVERLTPSSSGVTG